MLSRGRGLEGERCCQGGGGLWGERCCQGGG